MSTEQEADQTDTQTLPPCLQRLKQRITKFVAIWFSMSCCANCLCCSGALVFSCGCGLITLYLLASNTTLWAQEPRNNLQNYSVPGFVLIFIGSFFLMCGILFCWVIPNVRRNRARNGGPTIDEILEAGFGSYDNPITVSEEDDLPPSYANISHYPVNKQLKTSSTRKADHPPRYCELSIKRNGPRNGQQKDTYSADRRNLNVDEITVSVDTVSNRVDMKFCTD